MVNRIDGQSRPLFIFDSADTARIVGEMARLPHLSRIENGVHGCLDAVIVENEWGWVEEITATYVVVRLSVSTDAALDQQGLTDMALAVANGYLENWRDA